MELIHGINHITFVTADIDRLVAFYQRVFDAPVRVDLEEDGLRHVLIEVGPDTYLHPFQIPGIQPPGEQPMFRRGRLDHFAFNAASEAAFREIHRRVMAEGRDDGVVTDMQVLLLFTFTDPDGGHHEVAWQKPGVPLTAGGRRADWTTYDMKSLEDDNPFAVE